jgi:hypothetical protein
MNSSCFFSHVDEMRPGDAAKIAAYGFDGVIISQAQGVFAQEAGAAGLKVIINPVISKNLSETLPFHKNYELKGFMEGLRKDCAFDMLYWESPYLPKNYKKELLEQAKLAYEIYQEELACLEKWAPVLYSLPASLKMQDRKQLQKKMGGRAYLLFSVYEGSCSKYYLPENPLWQIRGPYAFPKLRLLAETLPFFLTDAVRQFFMQPLNGAVIEMDKIPEAGSFGDANLGMCLQALKGQRRPEDFLGQWLQSHKPYLSRPDHFSSYLALYGRLKDNTLPAEDFKTFEQEAQVIAKRLEREIEKENRCHAPIEYIKDLQALWGCLQRLSD